MNSIKITENIYWVGVKDPDLRVFDIYVRTDYGTTYNSYLLLGEKNVLIDTVKHGFEDDFLAKIREHIPIEKLDYLIINHTEPDHSGALPTLLKHKPDLKIYCAKPAVAFLRNVINDEKVEFNGVKGGEILDLGDRQLEFISAPYLHWPDTMFCYDRNEKVLFPCDGFGAHFCPSNGNDQSMFYQAGDSLVDQATKYYYDTIMRPYSPYCRKAAERVAAMDIKITAPSHGVINSIEPKKFIHKYLEWTDLNKPEGKTVIIVAYASSYGSTKMIAKRVSDRLKNEHTEVELIDILTINEDQLRDKLEIADAVLFGSPTFVNDVVRPVWQAMTQLSSVFSMGKKAAAFGSYGWGGQAVNIMENYLENLKLKVFKPGLKIRLIPSKSDLKECDNFADGFLKFIGVTK